MDNLTTAGAFFEACDYGKGWSGCRSYCHDNASFETAAETLAEIDTLGFQQKILKLIIYLLEICAHCVIMFSQELGFQIFHVSKNATLCSIKQLLR